MASPSPHQHGPLALGRYLIRRRLGAGSSGTVYLAADQAAGRLVALKMIRADRLSREAVERLQEEFQAIASLHHPQIATAFDFGYARDGALPFYTREYIQGVPLPPGPPASGSIREFLRPILDLLDALEYLHSNGIVHLDVHPGNLIVADDTPRGSVLIDFGFGLGHAGPQLSTTPEIVSGLPPEMLGRGKVGPPADIFFAGRLLLYRLTGEVACDARLPREVPGLGPRRTLELERIAAKALQPDPQLRFRSAAEFREALAAVLGEPRREPGPNEPGDVTVGREAELRRIDALLARVSCGQTAAFWIAGSSGMGKTRLIDEARRRAQLQGLVAIQARFFSEPAAAPALLESLTAAAGGRKRKVQWLDPLSADHGGTPAERARRAVKAYFEEEEKPMVLLLDDLDHADPASRTLAEALIAEVADRRAVQARGRGLGIIMAMARLPRSGAAEEDAVTLRPLRRADSRRLLQMLVRPLSLPGRLLRQAAASAGGCPLRTRLLARALGAEWRRAGSIPEDAELPALADAAAAPGANAIAGLDPARREALMALAVLRRPASAEEVAASLAQDGREVVVHLRRLERDELAASTRVNRGRRYRLARPALAGEVLGSVPAAKVQALHQRMVRHLEGRARLDRADRESLARHLLGAGRGAAGQRLARETALELREAKLFDRALVLLGDALRVEASVGGRFVIAEEMSGLLDETGDHKQGAALLEEFYPRALERLSPVQGIRLRRRLGVHYHRSARVEDARRVFEEAQRLADPERDIEDLIAIDSELAELYHLLASYERSESACRRGLERLAAYTRHDDSSSDFRARMEVGLRGSRGHLELRRLNLPLARSELQAALRLSRHCRMSGVRAVLLNNLGIVENQQNDFRAADRAFRAAERLLLAAGEQRPVVAISCNLAVIAAKRGSRDEAHAQVERAAQLLRRFPGERLEFLVGYTRGVVASLLGDAAEVLEMLPPVLHQGRGLGDLHLTRFGAVYVAEALMACGRYREAMDSLEATAQAARKGPPVLQRMVQARLFLLAALLHHPGLARRAQVAMTRAPRTEVALLEAWNDIFLGLGRLLAAPGLVVEQGALAAESARGELESALAVFARLGVVFGEAFARLGLLIGACRGDDPASMERHLAPLERGGLEAHRFLAVAAPLACAEARHALGDQDRARDKLAEASAAIVGSPFLELDWRIELLRASMALKGGDPAAARGHLHRSFHARALLLQQLPSRARERALGHPRFARLDALSSRLETSPRLHFTSERLQRSDVFEGMVGRSKAMLGVFQAIDRLREHDLPVLVLGETGTGKDLVARAIHRRSSRSSGRFAAVHCAALPVELFESELFGCEPGAFTGAEEARPGLLESLEQGTLLLDEVAELPQSAQAKLLRLLDSGRIRRLGGTEERRVDVRFVAATGADLEALVEARSFRADLFYRLGGLRIRVPPLRERLEDVEPLARSFLEKHAKRLERPVPALDKEALRLLRSHAWPGNVRELEAVLLRVVVALSSIQTIGPANLEPFLRVPGDEALGSASPFSAVPFEGRSLEDLQLGLERAYLVWLAAKLGGDRRRMMEALGVKQSYFYKRLKELGLAAKALRGARR